MEEIKELDDRKLNASKQHVPEITPGNFFCGFFGVLLIPIQIKPYKPGRIVKNNIYFWYQQLPTYTLSL